MKDNNKTRLSKYRQEIDDIDQNILELLKIRVKLATKIGILKSNSIKNLQNDIYFYRPDREAFILNNLIKSNKNIDSESINHINLISIYKEIIAASLANEINLKIYYLKNYYYSSLFAIRNHFGTNINSIPYNDLEDIINKLRKSNISYILLPIKDNNDVIEQSIISIYQNDLKICSDIKLGNKYNNIKFLIANVNQLNLATKKDKTCLIIFDSQFTDFLLTRKFKLKIHEKIKLKNGYYLEIDKHFKSNEIINFVKEIKKKSPLKILGSVPIIN